MLWKKPPRLWKVSMQACPACPLDDVRLELVEPDASLTRRWCIQFGNQLRSKRAFLCSNVCQHGRTIYDKDVVDQSQNGSAKKLQKKPNMIRLPLSSPDWAWTTSRLRLREWDLGLIRFCCGNSGECLRDIIK